LLFSFRGDGILHSGVQLANTPELLVVAFPPHYFIAPGFAFHHSSLINFLREQYGTGQTSSFVFYKPYVFLRWLIQQCLSAQHMWLPVTPLCKPPPLSMI
jgi:hypothetical protein